ncbi:MAG: DUF58 domain-containing protein [Burkholderiales bacterium]|nr:DUF58 domain-containing protein [Burkholderiales bacterium]
MEPPSARGLRSRWLAWRRRAFGLDATKADQVELVQRRIYLLPTARGLFVILTAVLLLLVGVNYQLSLAYVVSFLLAGLMQAALLASYRNLQGLVVRAGRSPLVRQGDPLTFVLSVSSPERVRCGLRFDATVTAPTLGSSLSRHTSPRIAAGADAVAAVPLEFGGLRRGIVALGRIAVESRAPYGLVRAWSYVHFEWIGLVAPVPESPSPALPLTASDDDVHSAPDRHAAHDPDSLRDFVAGDSLKRVAWKQVAKSGRWFTRTGESGAAQNVELNWQDTTMSDTDARLSRLAAWVARADNEGCAFSLWLPNGQLAMAGGAQQVADATRLLAMYPTSPDEARGLR